MHTKSFLIGLAVTDRHLSIDEASQAAHVEVRSQIARWGEVEDCKGGCLMKYAANETIQPTTLIIKIYGSRLDQQRVH